MDSGGPEYPKRSAACSRLRSGAIAGVAVSGVYSSVAANFICWVLGIPPGLVAGVVTASLLAEPTVAQIVPCRLAAPTAIALGAVLLSSGWRCSQSPCRRPPCGSWSCRASSRAPGPGLLFT